MFCRFIISIVSCFQIDFFFQFHNSIIDLGFIICFDLLSIKLSQSHDLDHEFSKLTRVESSNFLCLLSMRLSWSHELGHEFCRLTNVDFFYYFFFIFILQYQVDCKSCYLEFLLVKPFLLIIWAAFGPIKSIKLHLINLRMM